MYGRYLTSRVAALASFLSASFKEDLSLNKTMCTTDILADPAIRRLSGFFERITAQTNSPYGRQTNLWLDYLSGRINGLRGFISEKTCGQPPRVNIDLFTIHARMES